MNWEKFWARAFTFLFALLIVLGVGYFVFDATLESAPGEYYTPENWKMAKELHCMQQGMELEIYIGQNCGFFGCTDVEKSKCVGDRVEKKIDYDDPMFCRYTMKYDWGWC